MKIKSMTLLSVVTMGMTLFTTGCNKEKAKPTKAKSKPTPLVQTAIVQQKSLVKSGNYTGSIEPVKTAIMASPAEGPIVHCSVREGDRIKTGDLLVQVGRRQIAAADLEAAREELSRLETEFSRIQKLIKSGSVPGDQLDLVRSNLKRAEAQVTVLETEADDYEIHAPWPGLVSKVWVSEGNYVVPRTPLVEIYDPSGLVVRLNIPEQHALSIRNGIIVAVTLDAHPGKVFSAEISRIFPELDRRTRTITVEAKLRENIELLSGMFARVKIPVNKIENAKVIPQSALLARVDGTFVVWKVKSGIVQPITVKVLLEANGEIAIEGDLQVGETVVIRGNESLRAGAKVKVMKSKNAEQAKK